MKTYKEGVNAERIAPGFKPGCCSHCGSNNLNLHAINCFMLVKAKTDPQKFDSSAQNAARRHCYGYSPGNTHMEGGGRCYEFGSSYRRFLTHGR